MRKGFVNGLLAGGVLGAILGMFMTPQLKPYKREMMSQGKMAKRQSRRAFKSMRSTIKDMMK